MAHGLSPALGPQFCGPTAIAAITGHSPAHVERVILSNRATHLTQGRRFRGFRGSDSKRVRMTWSTEIAPALEALGWRASMVDHQTARPTFSAWQHKARDQHATYVVLITGHFVAVSGEWLADTTYRTPVRLSTVQKYQRRRVVMAWLVEPSYVPVVAPYVAPVQLRLL